MNETCLNEFRKFCNERIFNATYARAAVKDSKLMSRYRKTKWIESAGKQIKLYEECIQELNNL